MKLDDIDFDYELLAVIIGYEDTSDIVARLQKTLQKDSNSSLIVDTNGVLIDGYFVFVTLRRMRIKEWPVIVE